MKMTISMDDELNKKLEEYAERNYTSKSAVIAQGVRSILMTDTILQMFSDVSLAVKQVAEKNTLDDESKQKLDEFMFYSKQLLATGNMK